MAKLNREERLHVAPSGSLTGPTSLVVGHYPPMKSQQQDFGESFERENWCINKMMAKLGICDVCTPIGTWKYSETDRRTQDRTQEPRILMVDTIIERRTVPSRNKPESDDTPHPTRTLPQDLIQAHAEFRDWVTENSTARIAIL